MKDWEMGSGKENKEMGKKLVEIDSGTGRKDCDHVCVWRELNRAGSLAMGKHADHSRTPAVSHSQTLRMGEWGCSCNENPETEDVY